MDDLKWEDVWEEITGEPGLPPTAPEAAELTPEPDRVPTKEVAVPDTAPTEEPTVEVTALSGGEAATRRVELPSQEDGQPDLEEALQASRKKQLENFRQNQEKQSKTSSPIRLLGEEEPEDPEEPEELPPPYPDEVYDRESGRAQLRELRLRRTTGLALTALTVLLELILTALALVASLAGSSFGDRVVFLTVQLLLLLLMAAVNHRVLRDGFGGLVGGAPNGESASAVVAVLVLLHTLLQLLLPDVGGQGETLTVLAGFHLTLCALCRQTRLSRRWYNLSFVAADKSDRHAAVLVEDPKTATVIGHSAVASGSPRVTYFRKTPFLKGFTAHAAAPDGEKAAGYTELAIRTGIALAVALLYGVLTPPLQVGPVLTAFAALMALLMPLPPLVEGQALTRMARQCRREGGMLSGQEAVDTFGDIDGLALDAGALFPTEESIRLLGIKTFANAQIDTAILDAAAVCIKARSPLAGVFNRVIGSREDYLQEVDTLVYEQEMGISGWVGGRRVLVGSRQLLQNHGVDVPSADFEQRHSGGDRRLVYLSTAGELTALFVLDYQSDPVISTALRELTDCGVSLLIRSCDPNITEALLCERFGLDNYYVEVLNSAAGSAYVALRDEPEREEQAVLACDGRPAGMARGLTRCHRLRATEKRLTVWKRLGAVIALLGYGLIALLGHTLTPAAVLLAFLFAWTLIPAVVLRLKTK